MRAAWCRVPACFLKRRTKTKIIRQPRYHTCLLNSRAAFERVRFPGSRAKHS